MREPEVLIQTPRPTQAVSVGYPGRDGAHSAAACDRLFPDAELVALPSFTAVAEAAAEGAVEFGVLPIESSLSGPVNETHDLLYESPLAIVGETVLPIRHCLVGPARVSVEEVRIVHSHPAALDQCRRLLAAMPWATAIAAATTADAAAHVAESGDPTHAAIASERAANLHGLTVIAGDVGDHPEAYTRFVSIATHVRLDNGGPWRTAFSFVTDHQPGALHYALEPFALHRIDLLQLVSRPIPHSPWKYRFDAVLAGHPLDPEIRAGLTELRSRTRQLRVFGSYPAEAQP
jgi:prephenate dehydratase